MPRKSTRRKLEHVAVAGSLSAARAALVAARAAGAAVTLVSPPGAAAYLGVGFFSALVSAARAEFPDVVVAAVMDCGDDPGWALSALRAGLDGVVLRGHPRARARVAAIAKAMGARFFARPPKKGVVRRGGGKKKGK